MSNSVITDKAKQLICDYHESYTNVEFLKGLLLQAQDRMKSLERDMLTYLPPVQRFEVKDYIVTVKPGTEVMLRIDNLTLPCPPTAASVRQSL